MNTKSNLFCFITIVFVILFIICYQNSDGYQEINTNSLLWIQRKFDHPFFNIFNNIMSNIVNPELVVFIFILTFVNTGDKLSLINFLYYFSVCTFYSILLKLFIKQPRPFWVNLDIKQLQWICYTDFGNPSGHSMLGPLIFQYYAFNVIVSQKKSQIRKYRVIMIIVVVIMTILLVFSRLALGAHNLNQVVFGILNCIYLIILYRFYLEQFIKKKLQLLNTEDLTESNKPSFEKVYNINGSGDWMNESEYDSITSSYQQENFHQRRQSSSPKFIEDEVSPTENKKETSNTYLILKQQKFLMQNIFVFFSASAATTIIYFSLKLGNYGEDEELWKANILLQCPDMHWKYLQAFDAKVFGDSTVLAICPALIIALYQNTNQFYIRNSFKYCGGENNLPSQIYANVVIIILFGLLFGPLELIHIENATFLKFSIRFFQIFMSGFVLINIFPEVLRQFKIITEQKEKQFLMENQSSSCHSCTKDQKDIEDKQIPTLNIKQKQKKQVETIKESEISEINIHQQEQKVIQSPLLQDD